jgi:WhiB family redox-sensing transcriptional regulator
MTTERRRPIRYELDPEDTAWKLQAKCASEGQLTPLFYPDTDLVAVLKAKSICHGTDGNPPCPVKDICLEFAIVNDEKFGVWGGTSERERVKLHRSRRRAALKAAQEALEDATP